MEKEIIIFDNKKFLNIEDAKDFRDYIFKHFNETLKIIEYENGYALIHE